MAVAPSSARPKIQSAQPFCWTREKYDQAVKAGVLTTDDKVELLDGQVVAKMPQNTPHQVATGIVSDTLRQAFGAAYHARDEKAINLSDLSKPEPDIAIVRGNRRDYLQSAPSVDDSALIVEVSDSTLIQDRVRKAALYAEAGIVEYWIVNLVDRVLEVHRDPAGGAYRTKTTHEPGDAVAPLNAPDAEVAVADLLP